jgi:hypothetical protein
LLYRTNVEAIQPVASLISSNTIDYVVTDTFDTTATATPTVIVR